MAMLGLAVLSLLAAAVLAVPAAADAAIAGRHLAACAGCLPRTTEAAGARAPAVAGAFATVSYIGAGYVRYGNGPYTAVREYWTVPTVNTKQPGSQYSADWAGIGDPIQLQAGTEADNIDGTAQYHAWTAILGTAPVTIPGLAIHPGDEIEGLVEGTKPNTWQLTVYDLTTGHEGGRTVSYYSTENSAEVFHGHPGVTASAQASTTSVTFEPGSYSTAAPGTQTWQPLLAPANGATVEAVFMLKYNSNTIIAAPSAADAYHDGFTVADSATSPAPPPEASQLVFDDYIGTVYSLQVDGVNQNGQAKDACFTTPKTVNLIPNWWWAAGTKIRAYTTGNCTSGELGGTYTLTDSPTVPPYHCQEDVSPYRDWNPGSNWQNCAVSPPPNHVWHGYATGSFVRNM